MDIIKIILTAVLTSCVSVWLALARYRTERWWDKKLEAYLQVIEDMNKILVYCDRYFDEKLDGIEIDDVEKNKAQKDFHDSKRHLELQANVGRLLFDNNTFSLLISINCSLHGFDANSSSQKILDLRGEIDNLLSSFIAAAKSDLGARTFWIHK